jgi:TIR domain
VVTLRKLFVSYARENKPDVDQLVEHLGTMGYETWVDAALRGGQDWWDEILERIADCDVIIAIYSSAALNSTACGREFEWAVALGKPVVPVAVEPPPTALPSRFARRQIIDYSQPSERPLAALKLQGALATLPPAPPLPDPLPEAPQAPLSYLTDLIDLIGQTGGIDHDQQHHILLQLEPALTSLDPLERRGGSDILERFSRRSDLYADVDRAITRLRQLADQPVPVSDAPLDLVDHSPKTSAQHTATPTLVTPPPSGADTEAHEIPKPVIGAGGNPLNVPAMLVMAFAALGLVSYLLNKATTWQSEPLVHYLTVGAMFGDVRNLLIAAAFWFLYRQFSAGRATAAAATTSLIASVVVVILAGADLIWRIIGGSASRSYVYGGAHTVMTGVFFVALIAVGLAASRPRQTWSWLLAIGGGIGLARDVSLHVWGPPRALMDFAYFIYLGVVMAAGILMYRQRSNAAE